MYLESAAKVGKKELALECDYEYELRYVLASTRSLLRMG